MQDVDEKLGPSLAEVSEVHQFHLAMRRSGHLPSGLEHKLNRSEIARERYAAMPESPRLCLGDCEDAVKGGRQSPLDRRHECTDRFSQLGGQPGPNENE
jgi:hypothetical protein